MSNLSIVVTGLTPRVTEKQLSDFFSFCGKISSMSLRSKDGNNEAVLTFEKESAAKTALLLSNAIIDEHAITVSPYTEEKQEIHKEEERVAEEHNNSEEKKEPKENIVEIHEVPTEKITHRAEGSGERTATAVIASLIAGGYAMSVDILQKARDLDEQKHITGSIRGTSETLQSKAANIDNQYHISETAAQTKQTVSEKWTNLDNQYNISQSALTATNAVEETLASIGETIAQGVNATLQQPAVQSTFSSISAGFSSFGKAVGDFFQPAAAAVAQQYNEIKEQSVREINLVKQEKERAQAGVEMEELEQLDPVDISNPNFVPPEEIQPEEIQSEEIQPEEIQPLIIN